MTLYKWRIWECKGKVKELKYNGGSIALTVTAFLLGMAEIVGQDCSGIERFVQIEQLFAILPALCQNVSPLENVSSAKVTKFVLL